MLITRIQRFDYNHQQQMMSEASPKGDLNRFLRIGNDFPFHGSAVTAAAYDTSPTRTHAAADLCSDMDPSSSASAGDRELQDFLAQEQQKLQFQNQVNKLTETCWDKCMTDKPSSRLDGRTETCLTNCVDRFLDTSLSIAQRFQNMLQKQISQ